MGNPGKPIPDTSRMASAQQRRRKRERMGVDPKVEGFIADVFGEGS